MTMPYFFILGLIVIFAQISSIIFLKSFLIYFLLTAAYALSWNLVGGICGQYSFGHAVYAGIGSYLAAYVLNCGVTYFCLAIPMILLFNGILGASLSFLSARFKVEHAYFTLLTIAFLECMRIVFENIPYFNGVAGYYIINNQLIDFLYHYFLYIAFFSVFVIFYILKRIMHSDFGKKCQILERNKLAAESIGINPIKNFVLMMFYSSMMTSYIGIISIFYYKNLFPEYIFSQQRSMHMVLPALIGGAHPKGPIFGAFIVCAISECLDFMLDAFDVEVGGLKQVLLGIILLCFVLLNIKLKKDAVRKDRVNTLNNMS
jgi:branched-chain amino acid transport system permease protein